MEHSLHFGWVLEELNDLERNFKAILDASLPNKQQHSAAVEMLRNHVNASREKCYPPKASVDSCPDPIFTQKQIEHMRDRFLQWKLPANFNPDGGISFHRSETAEKYNHPWPVGTNLLDASQAEEMVRFMVEGLLLLTINEK